MAMRGLTMMLVGSCEAYSLIGAMPHAGMRAASPQMIEAATNAWYYNSPQSKTAINWDPAFGDNINSRRETLSSASPSTTNAQATAANNAWHYSSPQSKTAINWDPAFGDNTNARRETLSSASAMTGVVTPTQANNDWYHASPQAKTAINWDPAFGDNTNARKAQLNGRA